MHTGTADMAVPVLFLGKRGRIKIEINRNPCENLCNGV